MKTLFPEIILTADVAVPLPIQGIFSYSVPETLAAKIQPGVRVRVPFRNRDLVGYIVSSAQVQSPEKIKPILDILDDEPVVSTAILELTKWVSEYYGSSWGEAIENALPKWVKYGKKAQRALAKDEGEQFIPDRRKDLTLSDDQKKALDEIQSAFERSVSKPILLLGITGSGKSEIYIRAIRMMLERGRSAICLVPEIALTEQLRRFFLNHFGDELEIIHSKLGDTERFLAWKRLEQGKRHVVLGPRSAIFSPVQRLGLVVMDEEHEGSYKQETSPRYHAREVAEWRARNEQAVFVMGTATPSLETMYRTTNGEVVRVDLTSRIDNKPLPEVKIVDLKYAGSSASKGSSSILTPPMANEIESNLKQRQGTLLLLNRRGFSTHIHCPRCGTVESCHSCQVSMTFHQEDNTLLCHYCNARRPVPPVCGNCKADLLRFAGFGTEKVESEVARRFPQARIARLDADSVRKKGSHEVILKEFREQRIDILIGTQMIAKGFDFPHVTLVGVILADVGLSLPDFRSSERTFQLLTQVAGRAGRGNLPGRVIIQTYSPDHPSIRLAQTHDYLKFYEQEIIGRYPLSYPPYNRLINIIIRSKTEKSAYLYGRALREVLDQYLFGDNPDLAGHDVKPELIGPAPLPFYKLRGHFRWHLMIKSPRGLLLTQSVLKALQSVKKASDVAVALDVDPLNIL